MHPIVHCIHVQNRRGLTSFAEKSKNPFIDTNLGLSPNKESFQKSGSVIVLHLQYLISMQNSKKIPRANIEEDYDKHFLGGTPP